MSDTPRLNPSEVRKTVIDFFVVPIIAFWALMSFGPFVGLVRITEPLMHAVNGLFLVTSLWGVLAGAAIIKGLMWSDARFKSGLGLKRLYLAVFGGVWCVFYLIFLFIPR